MRGRKRGDRLSQAEKKEAKVRAKEEAQVAVREASSTSSYLRKKAGYVSPEEERQEAKAANAKTLSTYLSKKQGSST